VLSSNAYNMEKRELVVKTLKRDTDGLTIVDLSKKFKISRNTIAIILAELKGAKLIRIRPVGVAKLHYWKKGRKNGS
jgi:Mn-dependent DtxR family transcriptional regulator